MTIDLSTLNPPQRDAVLHGNGPLVVFAGAGSGKTRVITHRIAHLIQEREVPAWRILAVTFTNKAAHEMRERLEHLVPGTANDLQVGTFHSVCARLLRRLSVQVGLSRDFVIYDDGDQKSMVTRVLRDLAYDEKRFPPRGIAHVIERAKQEMKEPSEVDVGVETPHVRKILEEYEKRMKACNALDFGDLIYVMVRALERNDALRQQLASRFQHVLVDEFQDTNHSQLRLILALTSVHRNVCVVGDDDQSIYRWRGADRRNILDFRTRFEDAEVVKLEQNYRSTKRILRAAHAIIDRARAREPKELWTENEDGAHIDVIRCATEREEAAAVVSLAQEMRPRGLSNMAVFYRIHAQARVIEEALRAVSIPYRVVGGIRFYDRAEVKDLLAYLRVTSSPEDDVSLLRIINVPARGIGKSTIEKVLNRAAATGTGVFSAVKEAAAERGGAKLANFVTMIESFQRRSADASLSDLAQIILDESGYLKQLENDDTAEADARIETLQELIGSMDQFDPDPREETSALTQYLERVTLQTDTDDASAEGESLTLMTVHAAKGLEFPTVVAAGMEEQLFPFRGLEPGADPEEIEEERRLAYVAFTRARERLVLTWASTRYVFGNLRLSTRSRFIDELPPSDTRRLSDSSSQSTSGAGSSSFGGASLGSEWSARGPNASESEFDRSSARSLRGAPGGSRPMTPSSRSDGEFVPGQRVRHLRYGEGKIISIGGGKPANAEVDFGQYGPKTIRSDFLKPA